MLLTAVFVAVNVLRAPAIEAVVSLPALAVPAPAEPEQVPVRGMPTLVLEKVAAPTPFVTRDTVSVALVF